MTFFGLKKKEKILAGLGRGVFRICSFDKPCFSLFPFNLFLFPLRVPDLPQPSPRSTPAKNRPNLQPPYLSTGHSSPPPFAEICSELSRWVCEVGFALHSSTSSLLFSVKSDPDLNPLPSSTVFTTVAITFVASVGTSHWRPQHAATSPSTGDSSVLLRELRRAIPATSLLTWQWQLNLVRYWFCV